MSNLDSVITSINQQVDGQALIHLTGYHPDKIQLTGHTLKCFCPVHQELAFRSLILNLQTHTYKCMMRRCRCFKGGSLVDFWAIFTGQGRIEAAIDLVEKLGLNIDLSGLSDLAEDHARRAAAALESGDLAAARAAIDDALGLDPDNWDWRQLSARIWQAAGDGARAMADHLLVLNSLLEQQKLAVAGELLARLQEEHPDNADLMDIQVRLSRQEGETRELVGALVRRAELLERQGNAELALASLREAHERAPDQVELLERIADLCLRLNRRNDLLATMRRLAGLLESLGHDEKRLGVLEQLAQLEPADLELQREIAQTLTALGRTDEACAAWIKLADTFEGLGKAAAAVELLKPLVEQHPDDAVLLERQAALFGRCGLIDQSIDMWCRLAAAAREADDHARATDYYERAQALSPHHPRLRMDLADWKISRGDIDGGTNDLFALASQLFEAGQADDGRAVLERIVELAPSDVDKRIRVGRSLERAGLTDEAFQSYIELARDLHEQKQHDAAQAICEEVRRLRPLDRVTLELRIDTFLSMNQLDDAVEACREVSAELAQQGNLKAAEAALARALQLRTDDRGARRDLARLYEATGRADDALALWLALANEARDASEWEEAEEAATEALRLRPGDCEARVTLALALEATGRLPKALTIWKSLGRELLAADPEDRYALVWLTHALELDPDDAALLGDVTRLTLALDGPEAARPLCERWLREVDGGATIPDALDIYRFAVANFGDFAWRQRLTSLLLKAGLNDEAADQLEEMLRLIGPEESDKARRHAILEQLMQLRPDSPEVRADLARSALTLGRVRETVDQFRELATIYLGNGRTAAALAMLEEALQAAPDDAELIDLVARLHEELGQHDKALIAYLRLAEINRRQSDRSRNIPVLEKILTLSPEDTASRSELIEIYESDGDVDLAVEHAYALARVYGAQPDGLQEQVATCRRIRSLAPDFVPAREMLVDGLLRLEAIDEAKAELDWLGDQALVRGELDRAEQYFRRIRQIDPEDIGSGERLARLYEASGRIDEATVAFEEVLASYERMRETARAIGVLQKLRRLLPESLDVRLRLARALQISPADRREAGEEWLSLIELAIDQENMALMERSIEEALPVFTTEWDWRLRLAELLTRRECETAAYDAWCRLAADAFEAREYEIVARAATAGLELVADDRRLLELRAEANRLLSRDDLAVADLRDLAARSAETGDHESAIHQLQQALGMRPRHPQLMEMLATSQLAAGQREAGLQVIRNLAEMRRREGAMDAAVAHARHLLELQNDEDSVDFLASLLEEAGRRDEALELWRDLAEQLAAHGNIDAALFRYARLLALLPGNIDILRRLTELSYRHGGMTAAMGHFDRLIQALEAEGDASAVEMEYRRMIELEPSCLPLKERLADHFAANGQTPAACQMLMDIIACWRDEHDEPNEALRVLRQLQTLDPDNLEVKEQEAVMLENLDRREQAIGIWRKIAQLHRQQGDGARAAGCLVHCAQLDPDNPRIQLETAETFVELGDTAQATQHFLNAIDLYDRLEQIEPCVEILRRVIALNPGRLDLRDALARTFERLGQLEAAADVWLDLGARLEEEDREHAIQVYTHLGQLLPDDVESRDRLARLYEKTNRREPALQQLRELARMAARVEDFEAEVLYLQRILAIDPQDVESLERLVALVQRPGHEDECFQLLSRLERVHCSAGRFQKALEVLGQLQQMQPDNPELMGRSIELLIKTGQGEIAAAQGVELIQVYFDRNDDQRALEMLSQVTEIDPGNVARRIELARLVHCNNRHQVAFQEFFLLASRLFGEGQWESCLQVCQAGCGLFDDDVRLRDLMARALLQLDRRSEAVEVQLQLAAIHEERGEENKAQRVYESILAEQPDHRATLEAMIAWALRHDRASLAVEHLVRLAESLYVAEELNEAIETMRRIVTIAPERHDLRARLGDMALEYGDAAAATEAWLVAARGLMEQDQFDAAIALYQKVRQLREGDLALLRELTIAYGRADRQQEAQECAIILADSLQELGEEAEARHVLEELAESAPNLPATWARLAMLYQGADETDNAVDAWCRLAELHRAARRPDAARDCLEAAVALAPDRHDLLEKLGDLLLTLGMRTDGIDALSHAVDALTRLGDHEHARDVCARILKLDPQNLALRHQHAQVLEALGDIEAAIAEYRQTARGYADAQRIEPALEILRHLLSLDPERIDERELYAKLLRRDGQVEACIQQYLLLLETIGDEEDPRRAIKYCRQILEENANHPQAHQHLCAIYERTEKWRQAVKECEWLADYYLARGDRPAAESHMRRALTWLPDELSMRTRLVDLLIEEGRMAEAADQLGEVARQAEARADGRMSRWAMIKACEIQPNDIEQHRRLADFLERQGDLAESRATRIKLIRLLLDAGEMEEARALAERVVDAMIEDDVLRIEIATMFEEHGLPEVAAFHYHHLARRALAAEDYEAARTHAQHTIELKPRHVGARETLITVLLARRENSEALRQFEELYELYEEAGEFESALRTLQSIIELVPSSLEPRRKLITLYRKMQREEPMIEQMRRLVELCINAGEHEQAIDCLRDLLAIRPEDTRARMRYIDLYTQLGDESELLEDYLQLARILGRKGSVVEAMRTYERLLQLHPQVPVCREEFVEFLFEQGQVHRGIEESRVLADLYESLEQPREAGRVLDRALNYAPDELDMRLKLAGIFLKTNRRGLALESYRSLARHYEQAGDHERLIEVIEKIVEIDQLNIEFRQRLAELYYRHQMFDKACRQSMALADQYLQRELYDLAEHEFRRVLEVNPEDTQIWNWLIDTHLKIGQLNDVLPDLHALADIYRRKGRLKDTITVYRRILQCEPDNAAILQRYIEDYMQIGPEQDLIDEYLRLAALRMKSGDVAEANRIYRHVLTLAPGDSNVRRRLDETTRMMRQRGLGHVESPVPAPTPISAYDSTPTPQDAESLRTLIRNYRNVLNLNGRNPVARAKLAELLEKTGEFEDAAEQWRLAAEQFLEKGDHSSCIDIVERLLRTRTDDTELRDLLSQAQVQRDSLRVLDGMLGRDF